MNSTWSYCPETPNLGKNRRLFEPCDLEIWWMTLKNNRPPLLSNFKLYALFHHHMWIQTGVTVRKRLSRVMTSVTLTFDLWPWPLAWTSLLSLVITPENFVMIRWQEHSEKGVTDRQTDRRTETGVLRAAWSQLKTRMWNMISSPATPTVCLEQKSENFQSHNVTLSMPSQSQQELPVRKQIRPRPSGFELN